MSLATEISRLERISSGSGGNTQSSKERYNAFLDLARLHQLTGNSEAALKAFEGALTVSPNDSQALLEQARLLISLGEYEKAVSPVNALLRKDGEQEFLNQGRYLGAILGAFRTGETPALAALADDPAFIEYRSGIYYTLWRLTGLDSWKTRLSLEFPQSPETKIAGGAAEPAQTPLWLLFPGRDSIVISAPESRVTQSPSAGQQSEPAGQDTILQTGLFGREENARAMSEQLKKAGFEPRVTKRSLNGADYWAVSVLGGKDMNAAITRLKDAGFEAFPQTNQ